MSSVQEATVYHDDTQAVENTILAADAAGGGTVQLDAKAYYIERPSWVVVKDNSVAYPTWSPDITIAPWWAGANYLIFPNGSHGNLRVQGSGPETTLILPPGMGAYSPVFATGSYQRPDDPSNPVTQTIGMSPVPKGSISISLLQASDAATLKVGDDVWLFSGTFNGDPCVGHGTLPGSCHYSELNTISAIDGTTITLAYPTTKQYFDDGSSSYGLVRLPVTQHNLALQHMTIKTTSPITSGGQVFGLLVDDLTMPGPIDHGPFGDGFKRGVVIENSNWSFGIGDASYGAEDEYDQFTDLCFINNTITGVAAPGAEGPSLMARLYLTEGTSDVTFTQNTMINASLYADQTTDVSISNNTFSDGVVNIGIEYAGGSSPYRQGAASDKSYLSFASQEAADVSNNLFTTDAAYTPPGIVRVGNFTSSNIANNVITYGAPDPMTVISTFSGSVTGNQITIPTSVSSSGIAVIPDESSLGPPSAFLVEGNVLSAQAVYAAALVSYPGFVDTVPICIENNSWNIASGVPIRFDPASAQLGCSLSQTTAAMQGVVK